jgi:hypothetical protein
MLYCCDLPSLSLRFPPSAQSLGVVQASGGEAAALHAEVNRLQDLVLQQELAAIKLRADALGIIAL